MAVLTRRVRGLVRLRLTGAALPATDPVGPALPGLARLARRHRAPRRGRGPAAAAAGPECARTRSSTNCSFIMPSQRSRFTAYSWRSPRSLILPTISAAASSAASLPSAVSRLCSVSALRMANSNSGTRCAIRSRTAASPCFTRRSHGSRPSGCTATNVWVTNRSSIENARSAARCPAASPSKVKMTSPRNWLSSISSRRRIVMCPSPNDVPLVATAVVMPARWQAITSV